MIRLCGLFFFHFPVKRFGPPPALLEQLVEVGLLFGAAGKEGRQQKRHFFYWSIRRKFIPQLLYLQLLARTQRIAFCLKGAQQFCEKVVCFAGVGHGYPGFLVYCF